MVRSVVRLAVGCLVLAGLVMSAPADEKKPSDGTIKLFNGKDMSGFKFELKEKGADPSRTWIVKDGVIECTGQPFGYFYTEKPYKNYVLRYDWRYPKEQPEKSTFNSGCLVHIQPPQKVWPKCVAPQGRYMDHGKLFFLGGAMKIGEVKDDPEARKKALKPKEEWNTTEISCAADGTITVKVNGVEVASGKSDLKEGQIGWQSEGAAIHFRNIVLMEK
jgi:hypothetical protein